MKPRKPIRDDEIDTLLARRYRDTTPEFEARWVALRRDLRQTPVRRRWSWSGGTAWIALGAAVAALLVVASFDLRRVPPPAIEPSPALAELFAMESVLSRGSALLDAENREALLHLPAPAPAQRL
ncbi:MAG: hypothetical protein JNL92_22405 [Opitutaceae bacterium]|nr:hypothetical protein [Opitutaceae bacterium]